MRNLSIALIFVLSASVGARAQLAVHDPAVTTRNSITAVVKELLLRVQQEQHRQVRRMAQRLSLFTDLRKYALPEPPRWRTHGGGLFSQEYNDALIFGDPSGSAYTSLSQALVASRDILNRRSPAERAALTAQLATVNLMDAAAIAATNDTGQLRFNGRKQELPAIDALEAHVIDPSNDQSTTAVLDKMSGSVLIGARQRQARIQLLTGMVEQLLVDSKRARDTETGMINMQLVTWRERKAAGHAFVAGSGDALRNWRQP